MNILEKLKSKAKKIKDWIKTPSIGWLKAKIEAEHTFSKTLKSLKGSLHLTAKEKTKVKKIQYTLIEEVDPIIWKRNEDRERIWTLASKKWFTLKEDEEKEINFSLPIKFSKKKWGNHGGMDLLNEMSEKSKKTAVNYHLIVDITYLPESDEESKTKTLKHKVHFD